MTRNRGIPTTQAHSLAGSLLLAHPFLREPAFRRSVLLLVAHGVQEGAMGVILNRPQRTPPAAARPEVAIPPDIPLYHGGPVEPDKVIFAGWHMDEIQRRFQLHFGLDLDAVNTVRAQNPLARIRAFLGYAGWSAGQLEQELASPTWILSKIDPHALADLDGRDLWRTLVKQAAPELALPADAPDDPDLN